MHCSENIPDYSLLDPEVEKGLGTVSETLADLYHSSLGLFLRYDPREPSARITLSHACYSMRDLMNDLPDSFPGRSDPPRRSGDEHLLVRKLVTALDNKPLALGADWPQTERVVIDGEVARALDELHRYEQECSAVSNQRLLLGVSHRGSYGGPAAIPWKAANDFFQAHTHVRTSSANKLPSKAEVLRHVDAVNNALALKVGQYFATKNKLQALLEAANMQDDDGNYAMPPEELVSKALSSLGDVGLRFVFFSGLKNPRWVRPLMDKGAFNLSARPIETGAFSHWPEGDYLRRMSGTAPSNVVKAFCSIDNWDNPSVIRSALGALANMQRGEGEALLQRLAQAARDGGWLNSYIWDAGAIIESIRPAFGGIKKHRKVGEDLARQCLMPKAPNTSQPYREPEACVPSYQYKTLLSGAIGLLSATSAFGFVKELMEAYSTALGNQGSRMSGWWIPSIEDAINSERTNIGNDLIRAMARVLRSQLFGCPDSFKLSLDEKNGAIIRRVSLFVLKEEYERDLHGAPEVVKGLVSFAVNSNFACDWNCDAEYFPLVRLAADNGVDLNGLWERIPTCIAAYAESFFRRSVDAGEIEVDARRFAESNASYRKYRVLSLIGKQRLPGHLRKDLSELSEEYGNPQVDDAHIITTGWISPHSPLSAEEMQAMGPTALVNRLNIYMRAAEEADSPVPFAELNRELTDLLRDNPLFFDGLGSALEELHPEHLNAVLLGWDSALMRGRSIPLQDVLSACRFALTGKAGRTPNWSTEPAGLAFNALSLLDHIPNSRVYRGKLSDWANAAIEILIAFAEANPDDVQGEQGMSEGGWDEMTISANMPHSESLAALIDWIGEADSDIALDGAEAFLKKHLPSQSESIANAAVFGRQIAKLEFGKHERFKQLAHDVYGDSSPNQAQKTALSVTLTSYAPSAQLMGLLLQPMQTALRIGTTTYPAGWSAGGLDIETRIGIWLLTAFAYGAIGLECAAIQTWDCLSSPASKRLALCRALHAIGNDENAKPPVRESAMRLCDHYMDLAENSAGFSMPAEAIMHLVLSGAFSERWWVPSLTRAMQAEPDVDVLLMMEQELIKLSETEPRSALDILMSGVKDCSKGGLEVYVAQKLGPAILANALEQGNAALERRVATCMDELGFLGVVDLDERVKLYRADLSERRKNDRWAPLPSTAHD